MSVNAAIYDIYKVKVTLHIYWQHADHIFRHLWSRHIEAVILHAITPIQHYRNNIIHSYEQLKVSELI